MTLTAVGAAAVGVLAAVDPNEPGHFPTCPFLSLTGLWCPGCGSLRTVHALVTGDPVTALERNPLAVVLLPVVAVLWVAWGLRAFGVGVRAWHPTRLPAVWLWGLLAVVVVYTVLRNLPGWTFLSPA